MIPNLNITHYIHSIQDFRLVLINGSQYFVFNQIKLLIFLRTLACKPLPCEILIANNLHQKEGWERGRRVGGGAGGGSGRGGDIGAGGGGGI